MAERRRPGKTIAVEEVRLDGTDLATAHEAPRLRSHACHRWRASMIVGAVVGALATGALAIAVWNPSGGDEQAGPSTTAPGPIRATGRDDRRPLLTDLPAGFHATALRKADGGPVQPAATAVLYRAPGASVDDGEWLLAIMSPAAVHLPLDVGFRSPPRATFIGDAPGAVGRGAFGEETTAFDHPQGRMTLLANELPAGTTETLAREVRVERGVIDVPVADVSVGLVRQPVWQLPRGLPAAGALTGGIGEPDGWHALYGSDAGAEIDVAVSAIAADQVAAVAPLSTFFLTDVSTAVVRGRAAIVGREGETVWVVWTEGTSLVTVALKGVDPMVSARVAGSLRLASDPDWNESAWSATALATARSTSAAVGAPSQPAGDDVAMRIVGRGPLRGATSWWDVIAEIEGTELIWALRTGHNPVSRTRPTDANTARITPPLTLAASGQQMFSRDPPGAHAGEVSDWYAAAVAVGDASLAGAVLRLTTDGSTTATIESALAPVRGVDGHLIAAVALPWTDHYTVEVVAADGTVLASITGTDDT